jgi:hypothetical protein
MKKHLIPLVFTMVTVALQAQGNKSDVLQNLEKNNTNQVTQAQTATMKSASRLFSDKNDITSVILIIPSASSVNIIDSDSTYYHVTYNNNEGFIFKRDAIADAAPANNLKSARQHLFNPSSNEQDQQNNQPSKFSSLQNKYGTSMATLLNAGKIWKGMTTEMVRDSWGEPVKINKTFEGNLVQEEWIYRNTWLYIENGILSDWGPLKK